MVVELLREYKVMICIWFKFHNT